MDVVLNSYNISTPLANINSNAVALIANHAALPYGVSGIDFDLDLIRLSLQSSTTHRPNEMSPFLFFDGVQVQGIGGMVLGAEIGATIVVRGNDLSTTDGSKVASISSANYGTRP